MKAGGVGSVGRGGGGGKKAEAPGEQRQSGRGYCSILYLPYPLPQAPAERGRQQLIVRPAFVAVDTNTFVESLEAVQRLVRTGRYVVLETWLKRTTHC